MIAKCRLFIKQRDTTVLWLHAHCKLFSSDMDALRSSSVTRDVNLSAV